MNGILKTIIAITVILGFAGAAAGAWYSVYYHKDETAIHFTMQDVDGIFATDVDLNHQNETMQIKLDNIEGNVVDIKNTLRRMEHNAR